MLHNSRSCPSEALLHWFYRDDRFVTSARDPVVRPTSLTSSPGDLHDAHEVVSLRLNRYESQAGTAEGATIAAESASEPKAKTTGEADPPREKKSRAFTMEDLQQENRSPRTQQLVRYLKNNTASFVAVVLLLLGVIVGLGKLANGLLK